MDNNEMTKQLRYINLMVGKLLQDVCLLGHYRSTADYMYNLGGHDVDTGLHALSQLENLLWKSMENNDEQETGQE